MSEDSQRVVFLRFISEGAEVRLYDTASGNTTTLAIGWSPIINAAGTKVAFVNLANELAVVDTQTGETTAYVVGPITDLLSITADGSHVAFISPRGDLQYPQAVVIDVATGQETQVSDSTSSSVSGVAVSGDGARVVWTEDYNFVKLFDASSGVRRDLGVGNRPAITKDGATVAYINDWGTELRLVDVATGSQRVLTTSDRGFSSPTFSANGQRIVFLSSGDLVGANRDLDVELFIVDVASGRVTQVTNSTGNNAVPTVGISGDGRQVSFPDFRPLTDPNPEGNFEMFLATCAPPAVVPYDFGGFESPLLADGSASFKKGANGRTLPVKFQLRRDGQIVTTAAASIAVHKVLDTATGTVDMTDLTLDAGQSNADSCWFRFDPETERYVFNLSTRNMSAPSTYRIQVMLDDQTVHSVNFSLR
jgi:WD40-like Beta Propeller Repeat